MVNNIVITDQVPTLTFKEFLKTSTHKDSEKKKPVGFL